MATAVEHIQAKDEQKDPEINSQPIITFNMPMSHEELAKKKLWGEHWAGWRAFFPKEIPEGWTIHQADLRRDVYQRTEWEELAANSLAEFVLTWQEELGVPLCSLPVESFNSRRPEQSELWRMMRTDGFFISSAENAALLNKHISGESAVYDYSDRVWYSVKESRDEAARVKKQKRLEELRS